MFSRKSSKQTAHHVLRYESENCTAFDEILAFEYIKGLVGRN